MEETKASFQILRLLESPGIGTARVHTLLDLAKQRNMAVHEMLADAAALRESTGKGLTRALCTASAAHEVWKELERRGISLLAVTDEEYPERLRRLLGRKAPPLLTVLGNRSLLSATSVGFCGSRDSSEKGIETARDCARQLASRGINVISGYARGVDAAAHRAALEEGGTTTVVLAEGILHFRCKTELAQAWDWDRIAVLSEFSPSLGWQPHNAMRRNFTICALSDAMVLIEARNKGGSIEAGRTARQLNIPLFAPVYEGMPEAAEGNRELIQEGACPLYKNRRTGRGNLARLFAAITRHHAGQLSHLIVSD
jgi:DNA processing protein